MKTMTALVWSLQFPMLTFFPSARFCLPLVLLPLSFCLFFFSSPPTFTLSVSLLSFSSSPFFLLSRCFPPLFLWCSWRRSCCLGTKTMVKLIGRSSLFFSSSSILPSLCFFAFCVFLNLFASLCFLHAFSISPLPPGSPLLGLSSGFYSQRIHVLLRENSNGHRALSVKRSP